MIAVLAGFYLVMGVLPIFTGSPDHMNILIMILIWAVVASCWDVIMGFAGIFSFGQVAFYVIGAYASAILSVSHGVPPLLSIVLAGSLREFVESLSACPV